MHHLYCLLLKGQLHLIKFKENPQRILDIGTGTGIWAIDMAEFVYVYRPLALGCRYANTTHLFSSENPWAEVTGIDLSPIQPKWYVALCPFYYHDCRS